MLLLTATPMQLHDFELYSMIELVEPGLFRGYADFATSREEIAAINEAVTVLRSQRPRRRTSIGASTCSDSYDAPVELLEAASAGRDEREVAAAVAFALPPAVASARPQPKGRDRRLHEARRAQNRG